MNMSVSKNWAIRVTSLGEHAVLSTQAICDCVAKSGNFIQEKLNKPNTWSKEALRDAAARDFEETEEKVHIHIFNDGPADGTGQ